MIKNKKEITVEEYIFVCSLSYADDRPTVRQFKEALDKIPDDAKILKNTLERIETEVF